MAYNDHTVVTQIPTSQASRSRAHGTMGAVIKIVRNCPYLVLTALTILVAAELWLAHARLLPSEHEWALGWMLFLSILAWSSTTSSQVSSMGCHADPADRSSNHIRRSFPCSFVARSSVRI